jgi:hypothetical protein
MPTKQPSGAAGVRAPMRPPSRDAATNTAIVDQAIDHIRRLVTRRGRQGQQAVGQCVLDLFYKGDIDRYRSTGVAKAVTLRVLEERAAAAGLPLKRSFLSNAVGVAALARQLGRDSPYQAISPSHQVELLQAITPERAEALARECVEHRWSVRELRAKVRQERIHARLRGRGRRPLPKALRVLRACARALVKNSSGQLSITRADIWELEPGDLAEVRRTVLKLARRLSDLSRLLSEEA